VIGFLPANARHEADDLKILFEQLINQDAYAHVDKSKITGK
jgi:hypothetical protein